MFTNLLRDSFELVGLVAEEHEIHALRELAVAVDTLAAKLVDQRLCAPRTSVGAEHGRTPATRNRARHVARAYESDLHQGEAYLRCWASADAPTPAQALRLIEEALLDQTCALVGGDFDVLRGQQEDLVGDPLHAAIERVGESAGEVDQAL